MTPDPSGVGADELPESDPSQAPGLDAGPRSREPAAGGGTREESGGEVTGRWWQGAVLYQVYVRSFQDGDGDGSGDLVGLRARLDYLAGLGVDGIWLSPTMPSPDTDWGYDVSDYRGVHPELGTLDDLDALVADAAARGIRVLLDLVPNHTSDRHPWFVEAVDDPSSPRRTYYVWADPAPGGGPPNNWRDATGAPAWTLEPRSGQYYLHNFLPTQPDLNWWSPAVHAEFEAILRYWMDRGIAGFRIDVAHGLYKDAALRDDPPLGPGDRPRPGGLRQVYSANRPETHGVYRDWRYLADAYRPPRVLLGETFVTDVEDLARFYGNDDELHLAFNFPFALGDFDATTLARGVDQTMTTLPEGACPTWTASNHDILRFPSRWCAGEPRRVRAALAVLLSLPGTVVLYYGDEIGMTDVDVPPERQRDPMTWRGQGGGPNRDRARTPLPWTGEPGGGFTNSGVEPWLPLGDQRLNVADQADRPDSVLSLTRELVSLRRRHHRGKVLPYHLLEQRGNSWRFTVGPLEVHANLGDAPLATRPLTSLVLSSDPTRATRPSSSTGLGRGGRGGSAGPDAAGTDRTGPDKLEAWEVVIGLRG